MTEVKDIAGTPVEARPAGSVVWLYSQRAHDRAAMILPATEARKLAMALLDAADAADWDGRETVIYES